MCVLCCLGFRCWSLRLPGVQPSPLINLIPVPRTAATEPRNQSLGLAQSMAQEFKLWPSTGGPRDFRWRLRPAAQQICSEEMGNHNLKGVVSGVWNLACDPSVPLCR